MGKCTRGGGRRAIRSGARHLQTSPQWQWIDVSCLSRPSRSAYTPRRPAFAPERADLSVAPGARVRGSPLAALQRAQSSVFGAFAAAVGAGARGTEKQAALREIVCGRVWVGSRVFEDRRVIIA